MIELDGLGSGESLHEAAERALEFCRAHGYTEARRSEIATALHEALSNALMHGHRGDPARPIRLRMYAEGESIWIEVRDGGPGVRALPPLPDLSKKLRGEDRPTGWGIFLMRSLASELVFVSTARGGHTVRMRFERQAPAAVNEPRIVEGKDDEA